MKKYFTSLLILLMLVLTANAAVITLKDGSVFQGQIQSENKDTVILKSGSGSFPIQRSRIKSVDYLANTVQTKSTLSHFSTRGSAVDFLMASTLIEHQKFRSTRNKAFVREKTASLPYRYRATLYEIYSAKWPLLYMGLNVFPGLGSLIQRDYLGAGLELGGMFLGVIMIQYGIYQSYYSGYYSSSGYYYYSYNTDMLTAGAIVMTVFYLYGLVRPFFYASGFNRDLEEALGMQNVNITAEGPKPIFPTTSGIRIPLFAFNF